MAPNKEKSDHLSIVETHVISSEKRFDLLDRIQREFISHCTGLLETFYKEAENKLFDYSRKAPSNVDEVQYFEAGQELSRQRLPISTDFLYQISKLYGLDKTDKEVSQALLSFDQLDVELAVVEQDDLEVEIAVKRMTSAARVQYKEPLYELVQRMSVLYPDSNVNEDNNPLDPYAIANAAVGAIQKLYKAPLACRAMVFKVFETSVLKELGPLYQSVNARLIKAGVLPVIKKKYNKPVNPEGPGSRTRNAAVQSGASNIPEPEPFHLTEGSLGSLMSQVRTSLRQHKGLRASGGEQVPVNFYIYTNNPGPELASMEFTERLSEEQRVVSMDMPLDMPSNVVPIVVARALSNKGNTQQPHALSQDNEDIINLVAVFFDKILEDENLPIEVQSLICRLQIPVLKLAIKDAMFLSNPLHPARQLINDFVRYGQKLDRSRSIDADGVFKNMLELVANINQQYRDDDTVFSRARADLNEVLEREEKRAAVVERRTRVAEEGKVKLKAAKDAAEICVAEALEHADVPDTLVAFLQDPWMQVLVMAHLKQGRDGETWQENKALVPEMIRVSEKYAGSMLTSLNLLTSDIKSLIERVDKALSMAFPDANTKEEHLQCFEVALLVGSEPSKEESNKGMDIAEDPADDDDFFSDVEVVEELVVQEKGMTAMELHQQERSKLESTYISLAENMPEGTWLSYRCRGVAQAVTCKLSKRIDDNLFLFVNRFGAKVNLKTFTEFAMDLQTREAKILDSAPFFDRIMHSAMRHFSDITH